MPGRPGLDHEMAQGLAQGEKAFIFQPVNQAPGRVLVEGCRPDSLKGRRFGPAGSTQTFIFDRPAAELANRLPNPGHGRQTIWAQHMTGAATIGAGWRK